MFHNPPKRFTYTCNGTTTTLEHEPFDILDLTCTLVDLQPTMHLRRNIPCQEFQFKVHAEHFEDDTDDEDMNTFLQALAASKQLQSSTHLNICFPPMRHYSIRPANEETKNDDDNFYSRVLQMSNLSTKDNITLRDYPGLLPRTMKTLVRELQGIKHLTIYHSVQSGEYGENERATLATTGLHLEDIHSLQEIIKNNRDTLHTVNFDPLHIVTHGLDHNLHQARDILTTALGACPYLHHPQIRYMTWDYKVPRNDRNNTLVTMQKNYDTHHFTYRELFTISLGNTLSRISLAYFPNQEITDDLSNETKILALAAAANHPNALFYLLKMWMTTLICPIQTEANHRYTDTPPPTKRHKTIPFRKLCPRRNPLRQTRIDSKLLQSNDYLSGKTTCITFADCLHLATDFADTSYSNGFVPNRQSTLDTDIDETAKLHYVAPQLPILHNATSRSKKGIAIISFTYLQKGHVAIRLHYKLTHDDILKISLEDILNQTHMPIPSITSLSLQCMHFHDDTSESLFLRECTQPEFAVFLRMINRSCTNLESLTIHLSNGPTPKEDANVAKLIQSMPPTLTKITLKNIYSDLPATLLQIQTGNFHLRGLEIITPQHGSYKNVRYWNPYTRTKSNTATMALINNITSAITAHTQTLEEIHILYLPIADSSIVESTTHQYTPPDQSQRQRHATEALRDLELVLNNCHLLQKKTLSLKILHKRTNTLNSHLYGQYSPITKPKLARAFSIIHPNVPYSNTTITDLTNHDWYMMIRLLATTGDIYNRASITKLLTHHPQKISQLLPHRWLYLFSLLAQYPESLELLLANPPQQPHQHPILHFSHSIPAHNNTIQHTIAHYAFTWSTLETFPLLLRKYL